MDETRSSISDFDLPLMRIRKKSCKSFGGGFSVVRLEKVKFCSKIKLTKFFLCFKYNFSNLLEMFETFRSNNYGVEFSLRFNLVHREKLS